MPHSRDAKTEERARGRGPLREDPLRGGSEREKRPLEPSYSHVVCLVV